MESTQSVRTAKSVVNRIKRGNIQFSAYFQRQVDQWGRAQKALLIDSMLQDIPIPGIYLEKREGTYLVIDGCQRLSTITEFMNGEFRLPRTLPPVGEWEVGGKTYQTLPEQLQNAINDYSLILCVIESASAEEVVELFRRLNNGQPLTAAQKNKALLGERLAARIAELAAKPVFAKILSPTQMKRDEAQMLVVQSLMLLWLDEVNNMRNKQIQTFIEGYAQELDEGKLQLTGQLFDLLDEILPEGRNPGLKKLSVPAIIRAMLEFYQEPERVEVFRENLLLFLADPGAYPEYVRHVSARTTDKEHIYGRVRFFGTLAA